MYKNDFVVVLKNNGHILREIDNIVSLPFGEEYSILCKNLNSRRALIDIQVDGKDVLNNKKIIINGNDEIELKGFMDGMNIKNRFKFIQKTKEISEYRGDFIDDGIVRVHFQFEKPVKEPEYYIYNDFSYMEPTKLKSNSLGQYSNEFFCNSIHNFCDTGISNSTDKISTRNMSRSINNEEGITVKGSQCNQRFREGYIGELESSSYVITLKLKGITDNNHIVYKPITIKTKLKCETCGKASKSHAKFCDRCGTSLI